MEYKVTDFDSEKWDRIIAQLPGAHVLQTWEWGFVKSKFGWDPIQLVWYDNGQIFATALVLKRSIDLPLFSGFTNILYVPKGPLLDWSNASSRREVLSGLNDYAKHNRGLFIKIDPDIIIARGFPNRSEQEQAPKNELPESDFIKLGWHFSKDQIQFKNTIEIDLSLGEDQLLANMKQKTRYNTRLATRKGVKVRLGNKDDIDSLYQMYAETSLRDGFIIREEKYYKLIWDLFFHNNQLIKQPTIEAEHTHPIAEPLIAEVDGEMVAAVIIFRFAKKAWYIYGMSRALHREKMPNYILQWEAIRRAKNKGCHIYDFWGAPDTDKNSDPLWGVYQFKEGFGGNVIRHIGAWDKPIKPIYYKIYNIMLPRLLTIMRISGRKSTEQSLYN